MIVFLYWEQNDLRSCLGFKSSKNFDLGGTKVPEIRKIVKNHLIFRFKTCDPINLALIF